MGILPFCSLLFLCSSFYPVEDTVTQLAIARIQYIYLAKQSIGDVWSSLGDEGYNIPLIYYTREATFISNPHEKFLKQFQPTEIFENSTIKVFKLDYRIDSIPFHMEVSMTFGEDTAAYDYYVPYIRCSSREEFETVTGYSTNTQLWASMVLHECFHGFQFLHKAYTQQALEGGFIFPVVGDSLQQLYTANAWFKSYVDKENNLLLKAIQTTTQNETDSLLREFFSVRNERRARTQSETSHDIGFLEKSFETVEGTARFIEAHAQEYPVRDSALEAIDRSFMMPTDQSIVDFTLPEYLYKTEVSDRYFYTTGYNVARLLKKIHHDDLLELFQQPSLTLEDILKMHL